MITLILFPLTWSLNSPFLGRQPKHCCLKNKERWTSLRLTTTPLKTSKWRLSLGTPANATACIGDGAALKASWLFLFSCDQCSLNIQHHMGPVPPVWTSWFSTQFCFFLFNKADGRQEIDRTERVIWIDLRNTLTRTIFAIKAKSLHFKMLFRKASIT